KSSAPVFAVSFGHKKVVVLAGYKTVKQALQNQAEEFADRDITPVFHDLNHGHGMTHIHTHTHTQSHISSIYPGAKGKNKTIIIISVVRWCQSVMRGPRCQPQGISKKNF